MERRFSFPVTNALCTRAKYVLLLQMDTELFEIINLFIKLTSERSLIK